MRPDTPGARTTPALLGFASDYLADGDPGQMQRRHGRLAALLLLLSSGYAMVIAAVVGGENLALQYVTITAALLMVPVLLLLPWARLPGWATVVPAVGGVLLLALTGGLSGKLLYSSCLYGVVFAYTGLTQRPGIAGRVGSVALLGLGAAAVWGHQTTDVLPIATTIVVSTCIGEVIALTVAWHRHARSELVLLNSSLARLVAAESEHEAAATVADVAARLLRADGAITLLAVRQGSTLFVGRGAYGADVEYASARTDVSLPESGSARCIEVGRPVFVADAVGHPEVRQVLVERFGIRSVVYIPVPGEDGYLGSLTVWWTHPERGLDQFAEQALELLTIQAGQVLERLRAVEALDVAATTDPLTGTGNRRAFDEDLQRLPVGGSVVVVDLDDFKLVNDRHGHSAGDEVLREFGAMLTMCVRDSDTVARLGGDEFALFLPTQDSGEAARAVLERLRLRWPNPLGASFSAGVAQRHEDESVAETLERADNALYEDKQRRLNTA